MPGAIGLIATFAAAYVGGGAAIATAVFYGTQAVLYGGLLIGAQLLSNAFRRQPKPEDVQSSIKSSTSPRMRHYGRVKTSGVWVFGDSVSGALHKVIALGTGLLDAIEEVWIDDHLVTRDANGWVTSAPYFDDGDSYARVQVRLGLPTETHYSDLTAKFPEWDSSHRGDGVSSLYAYQAPVDSEKFSRFFPRVTETLYRVVARGARIYNLGTATTVWSDNAANVIRDYMTHADGMRLPASLVTTPNAATGWLAAYNVANENVSLKAGGTEKRYRLWGSYSLGERPADVLSRMLASCDGRLLPTPDGGIYLEPGQPAPVDIPVLNADAIVGVSGVARGRNVLTSANVIRSTYTSVNHDYEATDADQWMDAADVSLRGEIPTDAPFVMSPSHAQCRRLMKITAFRSNPSWVGSFSCNLRGLAAFGKRYVQIDFPAYGIDEVFEIARFRFDIGEGGILIGVTLDVQSMPRAAYSWNAAAEEGTAPIAEGTTVNNTIPVPTGFSGTSIHLNVDGSAIAVARLTFDPPPVASLRVEARGKKTSETGWKPVAIQLRATEADSWPLDDGVEYEFQVRHVSQTGRPSAWSTPSLKITAYGDPVAPGALTGLSVAGGLGRAVAAFTTPASANLARVKIYRRATVGTPTESDLVASVNVTQSSPYNYVDGDASRTDLIVNGDFASGTGWVGTNWTISGGKANYTAGSFDTLSRTVAGVSSGDVIRMGFVISGLVAGSLAARALGGTTPNGPSKTTNGQHFSALTTVGATTALGVQASSFNGSVDDIKAYIQTPTCAPSGTWQYYLKAVNKSGFGTIQGPFAAIVI